MALGGMSPPLPPLQRLQLLFAVEVVNVAHRCQAELLALLIAHIAQRAAQRAAEDSWARAEIAIEQDAALHAVP